MLCPVLSSHVAQIMCVGRHHCAHHGTPNQFHIECQPVFSFYKLKRPATTLFFIFLRRKNKTRDCCWLCAVTVVYIFYICLKERKKERQKEYKIYLRFCNTLVVSSCLHTYIVCRGVGRMNGSLAGIKGLFLSSF